MRHILILYLRVPLDNSGGSKETVQSEALWNISEQVNIYGGDFLIIPPNHQCGGHSPCRPSTTAYSEYPQLPPKTRGRRLYAQPENAPYRCDKGVLYKVSSILKDNIGFRILILQARYASLLLLRYEQSRR